jgi:uncharacterized protein (DUF58 family)
MNAVTKSLPSVFPGALRVWLQRLHLAARRALEGGAGGQFASLFRGAGITFEELREYQPGDDIRAIEWKATARLGIPFVKRYIEERELTVVLAVDQSGSMWFGSDTRTKWQTAVECAALLVLLAAYNRDRVGLALFDSTVRHYLPPRRGLRLALRYVALLLHQQPQPTRTSLNETSLFLWRVLRRRSLVIIVSDFLDTDYAGGLARLAKKHELVALRVSDPAESTLPPRGLLFLEDCETGQRIFVDASRAELRSGWSHVAEELAKQFATSTQGCQIDTWQITTRDDPLTSLRQWLQARQRFVRYS